MKRLLAALLVGVFVLAGCGGATETTTEETATETTATEDSADTEEVASTGKTITILNDQTASDQEMELGKKFTEETGINVDYQIVPTEQLTTLLMTKLNSGEGPDIFGSQAGKFDIVTLLNVEENCLELTNEPWVANYDEFAMEQTSVDGKVYGMTYFDVTTDYYMVYNKQIFAEYGIEEPTSFSEFEAACATLLENDVIPYYEFAGDGWHQVMFFAEIGAIYEELNPGVIEQLNNNEIKMADVPAFEECLTQMKSLADNGYFGDNYIADKLDGFATALASDEYAMSMLKPGDIQAVVDASEGKYTLDDFGMFLIPLMDNDIRNVHPVGPSYFIWSGTENADEAKAYLEFLASQESVQHMIDNSPRVENLPFNVGQAPSYSDYTNEFFATNDKQGMVLQDTLKYFNPQWMDIGQDIVAMYIGDMEPSEVVAQMDIRREQQAQAASDPAWQ